MLIVEDEFLIALELRMVIEEEGAAVEEAASVEQGLRLVRNEANGGLPDVAVLDVRLGDEEVFPVADALVRRDVPFVFHSGHAAAAELTARYPGTSVLSKPAVPERLIAALARRIVP